MIIGTAGHIDHGKTTLVQALTGVDTDRLPEEKKRGISIELGYAFMDVEGAERVGFIDVPGHERLVHTMLAGASGVDHALLLVAADDGVMPQTREHLAVLSLLGLQQGTVVITKADRVDVERLQAVRHEVAALVQGSALQEAPVFTVSATTGQGIAELRAHLQQVAQHHAAQQQQDGQAFRLAVDRVFTLAGTGTVVTGTIHHGTVQVGDMLQLVPGERTVRVRSVHAQNQAVTQAHAGQRCALGLVGISKEEIERGQWLTAPAIAHASARMDVQLTLWHDEAKPLVSGQKVQLHVGADSVPATVAILEPEQLLPGQTALVQLVARRPVGVWCGDRVVLRDASATRTLAGGVVLDVMAPMRYRRTETRLAQLHAMQAGDVLGQVALSPYGWNATQWQTTHGGVALPAVPAHTVVVQEGDAMWWLDAAAAEHAWQRTHAALQTYHDQQPDEIGPALTRLRRLAVPRMGLALWQALVQQWQQKGALVQHAAFVHLPEHGVQLSATEQRIAQKTLPHIDAARFEGAWARDLASLSGETEPLVRATLARMARRGELHQTVRDLYYTDAVMRELAALVRTIAGQNGGKVVAAQYRDATGLGRKRAIQILEYFDRAGLLRRVGDIHYLRPDTALFQ